MRRTECGWESRLLDEVAAGRWPEAVDADLRGHLASCESCGEIVVLAGGLFQEREAARLQATVPPSGLVWWRAEMRARHEAARVAARPIHLAVALAATITVVALVALFGLSLSWPPEWLSWPALASGDPALAEPGPWMPVTPWIAWTLLAACLALGPVAIYLAVKED